MRLATSKLGGCSSYGIHRTSPPPRSPARTADRRGARCRDRPGCPSGRRPQLEVRTSGTQGPLAERCGQGRRSMANSGDGMIVFGIEETDKAATGRTGVGELDQTYECTPPFRCRERHLRSSWNAFLLKAGRPSTRSGTRRGQKRDCHSWALGRRPDCRCRPAHPISPARSWLHERALMAICGCWLSMKKAIRQDMPAGTLGAAYHCNDGPRRRPSSVVPLSPWLKQQHHRHARRHGSQSHKGRSVVA